MLRHTTTSVVFVCGKENVAKLACFVNQVAEMSFWIDFLSFCGLFAPEPVAPPPVEEPSVFTWLFGFETTPPVETKPANLSGEISEVFDRLHSPNYLKDKFSDISFWFGVFSTMLISLCLFYSFKYIARWASYFVRFAFRIYKYILCCRIVGKFWTNESSALSVRNTCYAFT